MTNQMFKPDRLFTPTPTSQYVYPIVSYDIANTFTEESIQAYLEKTYSVKITGWHPDPFWYGRGAVSFEDDAMADLIPADWESKLSETYDELEMYPDDEDEEE